MVGRPLCGWSLFRWHINFQGVNWSHQKHFPKKRQISSIEISGMKGRIWKRQVLPPRTWKEFVFQPPLGCAYCDGLLYKWQANERQGGGLSTNQGPFFQGLCVFFLPRGRIEDGGYRLVHLSVGSSDNDSWIELVKFWSKRGYVWSVLYVLFYKKRQKKWVWPEISLQQKS